MNAREPSDDAAEAGAGIRLAVGRIARRLRQTHAEGDMTHSEMSALARVDRDGPVSPGALAERERVRPQAMAVIVASLEERGLVGRRQDASDGRRAVISLTGAGRRMLTDRRSESVRRLTATLDREFTARERRELLAVLPLLDRLADRL